jgi:H/ACA ribonucleoprotein complex subunit 4
MEEQNNTSNNSQKNLLPFERKVLSVLVKKEGAQISSRYGKSPEHRSVEELIHYGIVNINKPRGPTSHEVSAFVQKILGINKSGHSGTLDPNVTGVLPVALGRATRVVQHLLTAGKEYVAVMHLHRPLEESKLRKVLNDFTGKIDQLPPIKSAVKRQWRERKIYYIEVLEIKEKDVLLRIGCEAGTYIRKLIHDIGQKSGAGAQMAELIRTKAAAFTDKEMWTLQDLSDAYWFYKNEKNERFIRKVILPIERAVDHLKKVWVLDSAVSSLCHGAHLKVPGIAKLNDKIEVDEDVAIMTLKNELVAVGRAKLTSKYIIRKTAGVAVDVYHVFMMPDTYPKLG